MDISPKPQERKTDETVPHVGYGKVLIFLQDKLPNGTTSGNTAKTFEINFTISGLDRKDCESKINKLRENINKWSRENE